jgi:hypothetical protein
VQTPYRNENDGCNKCRKGDRIKDHRMLHEGNIFFNPEEFHIAYP